MAELVDARDLKSLAFRGVPVQVRPSAPYLDRDFRLFFLFSYFSKDFLLLIINYSQRILSYAGSFKLSAPQKNIKSWYYCVVLK